MNKNDPQTNDTAALLQKLKEDETGTGPVISPMTGVPVRTSEPSPADAAPAPKRFSRREKNAHAGESELPVGGFVKEVSEEPAPSISPKVNNFGSRKDRKASSGINYSSLYEQPDFTGSDDVGSSPIVLDASDLDPEQMNSDTFFEEYATNKNTCITDQHETTEISMIRQALQAEPEKDLYRTDSLENFFVPGNFWKKLKESTSRMKDQASSMLKAQEVEEPVQKFNFDIQAEDLQDTPIMEDVEETGELEIQTDQPNIEKASVLKPGETPAPASTRSGLQASGYDRSLAAFLSGTSLTTENSTQDEDAALFDALQSSTTSDSAGSSLQEALKAHQEQQAVQNNGTDFQSSGMEIETSATGSTSSLADFLAAGQLADAIQNNREEQTPLSASASLHALKLEQRNEGLVMEAVDEEISVTEGTVQEQVDAVEISGLEAGEIMTRNAGPGINSVSDERKEKPDEMNNPDSSSTKNETGQNGSLNIQSRKSSSGEEEGMVISGPLLEKNRARERAAQNRLALLATSPELAGLSDQELQDVMDMLDQNPQLSLDQIDFSSFIQEARKDDTGLKPEAESELVLDGSDLFDASQAEASQTAVTDNQRSDASSASSFSSTGSAETSAAEPAPESKPVISRPRKRQEWDGDILNFPFIRKNRAAQAKAFNEEQFHFVLPDQPVEPNLIEVHDAPAPEPEPDYANMPEPSFAMTPLQEDPQSQIEESELTITENPEVEAGQNEQNTVDFDSQTQNTAQIDIDNLAFAVPASQTEDRTGLVIEPGEIRYQNDLDTVALNAKVSSDLSAEDIPVEMTSVQTVEPSSQEKPVFTALNQNREAQLETPASKQTAESQSGPMSLSMEETGFLQGNQTETDHAESANTESADSLELDIDQPSNLAVESDHFASVTSSDAANVQSQGSSRSSESASQPSAARKSSGESKVSGTSDTDRLVIEEQKTIEQYTDPEQPRIFRAARNALNRSKRAAAEGEQNPIMKKVLGFIRSAESRLEAWNADDDVDWYDEVALSSEAKTEGSEAGRGSQMQNRNPESFDHTVDAGTTAPATSNSSAADTSQTAPARTNLPGSADAAVTDDFSSSSAVAANGEEVSINNQAAQSPADDITSTEAVWSDHEGYAIEEITADSKPEKPGVISTSGFEEDLELLHEDIPAQAPLYTQEENHFKEIEALKNYDPEMEILQTISPMGLRQPGKPAGGESLDQTSSSAKSPLSSEKVSGMNTSAQTESSENITKSQPAEAIQEEPAGSPVETPTLNALRNAANNQELPEDQEHLQNLIELENSRLAAMEQPLEITAQDFHASQTAMEKEQSEGMSEMAEPVQTMEEPSSNPASTQASSAVSAAQMSRTFQKQATDQTLQPDFSPTGDTEPDHPEKSSSGSEQTIQTAQPVHTPSVQQTSAGKVAGESKPSRKSRHGLQDDMLDIPSFARRKDTGIPSWNPTTKSPERSFLKQDGILSRSSRTRRQAGKSDSVPSQQVVAEPEKLNPQKQEPVPAPVSNQAAGDQNLADYLTGKLAANQVENKVESVSSTAVSISAEPAASAATAPAADQGSESHLETSASGLSNEKTVPATAEKPAHQPQADVISDVRQALESAAQPVDHSTAQPQSASAPKPTLPSESERSSTSATNPAAEESVQVESADQMASSRNQTKTENLQTSAAAETKESQKPADTVKAGGAGDAAASAQNETLTRTGKIRRKEQRKAVSASARPAGNGKVMESLRSYFAKDDEVLDEELSTDLQAQQILAASGLDQAAALQYVSRSLTQEEKEARLQAIQKQQAESDSASPAQSAPSSAAQESEILPSQMGAGAFEAHHPSGYEALKKQTPVQPQMNSVFGPIGMPVKPSTSKEEQEETEKPEVSSKPQSPDTVREKEETPVAAVQTSESSSFVNNEAEKNQAAQKKDESPRPENTGKVPEEKVTSETELVDESGEIRLVSVEESSISPKPAVESGEKSSHGRHAALISEEEEENLDEAILSQETTGITRLSDEGEEEGEDLLSSWLTRARSVHPRKNARPGHWKEKVKGFLGSLKVNIEDEDEYEDGYNAVDGLEPKKKPQENPLDHVGKMDGAARSSFNKAANITGTINDHNGSEQKKNQNSSQVSRSESQEQDQIYKKPESNPDTESSEHRGFGFSLKQGAEVLKKYTTKKEQSAGEVPDRSSEKPAAGKPAAQAGSVQNQNYSAAQGYNQSSGQGTVNPNAQYSYPDSGMNGQMNQNSAASSYGSGPAAQPYPGTASMQAAMLQNQQEILAQQIQSFQQLLVATFTEEQIRSLSQVQLQELFEQYQAFAASQAAALQSQLAARQAEAAQQAARQAAMNAYAGQNSSAQQTAANAYYSQMQQNTYNQMNNQSDYVGESISYSYSQAYSRPQNQMPYSNTPTSSAGTRSAAEAYVRQQEAYQQVQNQQAATSASKRMHMVNQIDVPKPEVDLYPLPPTDPYATISPMGPNPYTSKTQSSAGKKRPSFQSGSDGHDESDNE